MRRFLLLLLALMTTGREASHEVIRCRGGWVDFTCPYHHIKQGFPKIIVEHRGKHVITSTKEDEWEVKDRVSLCNDTKEKILRVIVKELQDEDAIEWKCMQRKRAADKDGCQKPFFQTAYIKAETTITCEYQEAAYCCSAVFFCKDSGSVSDCERISLTEKSMETNFRSVSIRNVSSEHHKGIFWCGLRSGGGRYRAGLRLKVEESISEFKKCPKVGDTLEYFCRYPKKEEESEIFICKGEDPSVCTHIITTKKTRNGSFSMTVDQQKKNIINIRVETVTKEDSGTYWCGALSTDKTRGNRFFHRMALTAVPSPSTSSPVSTTRLTPAPREREHGSIWFIALMVCGVVLLLLFVLISIIIYKRLSLSKRSGLGAGARNNKEENVYEEAWACVTNPDSQHATKTVYATVNFPTNSSASLHYSAISFQQSSDKDGGEAWIVKPSSSVCEYSSVKPSRSPAGSDVYQPSRPSEDPLYSTVNKKH